jgi:hypothetical protein
LGAQGINHVRVHPTGDPLPLSFGSNQTHVLEFFDVVRNRRFDHVDLLAELTDIGCGRVLPID